MKPSQLHLLIPVDSPEAVLSEVQHLFESMAAPGRFAPVEKTFADILNLFGGSFNGYRSCNTPYHDLQHTTDCFLAMARLIHGAHVEGVPFSDNEKTLGLITALLHDTGYIQKKVETEGTGARYTLTHVERSIQFMEKYFRDLEIPSEDTFICRSCLECTGLDVHIHEVDFKNARHEILGKMLGAADLLGQMADRYYVEKLIFLYEEFVEGQVPGFENELDLLAKTEDFYAETMIRLDRELGGVRRFMRPHFRARWGVDRDLYQEAIERNMEYLRYILENHPHDYRLRLRREPFEPKQTTVPHRAGRAQR